MSKEKTALPSLPERILEHYDDFTRSERRLADVLLENQDALVLYSASQLSERVRTSKATTARFFQRLGYPSFKTAQRLAKEGQVSVNTEAERLTVRSGKRGDLSDHLAMDMQNLVRSVEQLRSDELAQAVQIMATADKLWVVGFGDNYALAHFARAMLIRVKPDIRMIPIGGFSVPEEFASIRGTDAMLALGVGRRTRALRSIMRSAVRADAHVILVTDQNVRASADLAAVSLRCRTKGVGVFDSVVAPVSLITHLCNALAARIGQPAIERLEFIDSIHNDWGDVLSGDL